MIELKIHMNSSITEVMEWKCCNVSGLNLELIFHNTGNEAVPAPASFRLENDEETLNIDMIYPPWPQQLLPKDYSSIYCSMDDETWLNYHTLSITVDGEKEYRYPIDHSNN